MTSVTQNNDEVTIRLSKAEALVLFEWLSRNSEADWAGNGLFVDPAEQQLVMWLEADMERTLVEPFERDYGDKVAGSYRDIVPDPTEWD